MMTDDDVLAVLGLLGAAGATPWLAGGWGVDALLGSESREHSDVDLILFADDLARIRPVLTDVGYTRVLRDWLPTALALADAHGREIDLHPVVPDGTGGGDQTLLDGSLFSFPAPVKGTIGGRPVLCVDAEVQVRLHTGYEPKDKDRADMARLSAATGVELPPELR